MKLLKLFARPEATADITARLAAGGYGYGDLKKALFEYYWEYFRAARARRAELAANLDHVEALLCAGAERARVVARGVMDRARRNCGMV